MRNSASYRKEAWELLTGNFWPMFLLYMIYFAVNFVVRFFFYEPYDLYFYELYDTLYIIFSILLIPLTYGALWVCLSFSRGTEMSSKDIIDPYLSGKQFLRTIGSGIMVFIFTFLWMLLLIIPGIVKSFSYALTPFIMKDDENIGVFDAITLSKKMMAGQKWRLFKLYFSFIGWGIVCMLTFGIAAFFVVPYLAVAFACFYNDVKENYESNQDFYQLF